MTESEHETGLSRLESPRERISEQFRMAWTQPADAATARPELLPVRLASACVAVLPVDGAGLSLLDGDFRVPLGASDEASGIAERLQFTQGEGPCLSAALQGTTIVADWAEIERRWPSYADQLSEHTPYRAVMSIPLASSENTRGTLDLFLVEESRLDQLSLSDALTVAQRVVEALTVARAIASTPEVEVTDRDEPAWLLGPASLDRQTVWVAMGMVMTRLDLDADAALALMRAYAFGSGTDVDDIAGRLVRGTLNLQVLAP
jgi:hypothetical protein